MAIKWEWLDTQQMKGNDRLIYAYRAKVPGGWMVMITMQSSRTHMSTFFYPDPEHVWDGSTLP